MHQQQRETAKKAGQPEAAQPLRPSPILEESLDFIDRTKSANVNINIGWLAPSPSQEEKRDVSAGRAPSSRSLSAAKSHKSKKTVTWAEDVMAKEKKQEGETKKKIKLQIKST